MRTQSRLPCVCRIVCLGGFAQHFSGERIKGGCRTPVSAGVRDRDDQDLDPSLQGSWGKWRESQTQMR